MSGQVRCLVWDLDNTLWTGTLLESDACRLRPGIRRTLLELDDRGILLSIASANDPDLAFSMLQKKRLARLFLHPQIGWINKVASIKAIAERLGIGLDSLGFVDDEPFELEQVRRMLPVVRTYPAECYRSLLDRPELKPQIVTDESRTRRTKYMGALRRDRDAQVIGMSHEEFLEYCGTRMRLRRANPADVPRILELMRRTHQLNSTGVVYDPAEVESFIDDSRYRVYIAELTDRFVDYGRIGVAVCKLERNSWELVAFLLSCRVLSRGISSFFLAWLEAEACREGAAEFLGRFRRSERNHRMLALYQLAGFEARQRWDDGMVLYARRPVAQSKAPGWLRVETEDSS